MHYQVAFLLQCREPVVVFAPSVAGDVQFIRSEKEFSTHPSRCAQVFKCPVVEYAVSKPLTSQIKN